MIIDFHTHIFPDIMAKRTLETLSGFSGTLYHTDGTKRGLLESMRRAGVDCSVTLSVATKPGQVVRINDLAIESLGDSEDAGKLIPFGAIHPDYEDCGGELKRLAAAGIKGIKIHPPYQGVSIDDKRFVRIIEAAAELDLIVLTHAGPDIGLPGAEHSAVEAILRLIHILPYNRLVLAHMGGWADWGTVKEYLCGAPVYLDTAFSMGPIDWKRDSEGEHLVEANMTPDEFSELVKAHGADRILFASDSPWAPVDRYLDFVRDCSGLSEEEKRLILGDNAAALLNPAAG